MIWKGLYDRLFSRSVVCRPKHRSCRYGKLVKIYAIAFYDCCECLKSIVRLLIIRSSILNGEIKLTTRSGGFKPELREKLHDSTWICHHPVTIIDIDHVI